MLSTIKLPGYLIISLLIVFLLLSPFIGTGIKIIAGAAYLLFYALTLGNWLFIKNSLTGKLAWGLFFILILGSLILTGFFYFYHIDNLILHITILLIPLLLVPVVIKYPIVLEFNRLNWSMDYKKWLLLSAYLLIIAEIFYLLITHQTQLSIRTPWSVLPPEIFLLYFFASLFLLIFLASSNNSFNLLLIIIHAFATYAVAAFVYGLGSDYDPFIHLKNVELILNNGTLLPKPFYYIGQYGLTMFINHLLGVSLTVLNRFLVPVLAAIYLPTFFYYSFRENFKIKTRHLWLIIAGLMIFPGSLFIATTPQALASLTFALTIIFSLYYLSFPKTLIWPLLLLLAFTLAVHPLAGLPLLFAVILILLSVKFYKKFNLSKFFHQGILWEIFILGCLVLPLAFIINSKTLSQLKVGVNFDKIFTLSHVISGQLSFFYRPFINIYDLIYDYQYNYLLLLLLLAGGGVYYLAKNGQLKKYLVYLMIFLMLLANYLLLKNSINFFSLVDYERLNYPLRLLSLAVLSIWPLLAIGAYIFVEKVFRQSNAVILLTLILLAAGLTVSFYLTYPRVDTIAENHGYSTSLTDIKTVNFIEELQNGRPYLVLASQPVSAAAILELGYKYYYRGYFFYPVPTGSRLYSLYENFAYGQEPTADIVATVRYLTGVNDIYFVINDYWLDAKSRITAEKENADHWYALDNKNFIFSYQD